MQVPFLDLKRATAALRPDIDKAISRVLDSGWFILGGEAEAFEKEFAASCSRRHAIGVASGTDAVELAIRVLDLNPGDEVITQANTCVPTVVGIERAGATPVLCDADPETGSIDLESLSRTITPRTRVIVPVHLYGRCADVDRILEIADQRDLLVVEDCAQAHGAGFRGRAAGTFGVLGCFSFYPTKNLGAVGDAGVVVTDDDHLAHRLRRLREYGQERRYVHVERGINSRLDELQAAVLRVKLHHADAAAERRREIGSIYDDALTDAGLRPLAMGPDRTHGRHLYVVRAQNRARAQERLAAAGVGTAVHYPHAIHQYEPYASLGEKRDLRGAEQLSEHVLSLPLFPELLDDEIAHVAAAAAAV
jgi:dTDP-4-amino-4,6-dideoxygalactose transaminase